MKNTTIVTHTPGPWIVREEKIHKAHSTTLFIDATIPNAARGFTIATMIAVEQAGEDTKANARLIAAAPELLDALKFMMDHPALTRFELNGIQGLIAKAEGR